MCVVLHPPQCKLVICCPQHFSYFLSAKVQGDQRRVKKQIDYQFYLKVTVASCLNLTASLVGEAKLLYRCASFFRPRVCSPFC